MTSLCPSCILRPEYVSTWGELGLCRRLPDSEARCWDPVLAMSVCMENNMAFVHKRCAKNHLQHEIKWLCSRHSNKRCTDLLHCTFLKTSLYWPVCLYEQESHITHGPLICFWALKELVHGSAYRKKVAPFVLESRVAHIPNCSQSKLL